jgi:hypothetical protein
MEKTPSEKSEKSLELLDLPRSLVEKEILGRLDPISLVRMSMTNTELYKLSNIEMQNRCKSMGFDHVASPRKRARSNPYLSPRKRTTPYTRIIGDSQEEYSSPKKRDETIRAHNYYRRKYANVACKPLCSVCWSKPGVSHPFFEERNVCWKCFAPLRFQITLVREFVESSNRFLDNYVVILKVVTPVGSKPLVVKECFIDGRQFPELKKKYDAWDKLEKQVQAANAPPTPETASLESSRQTTPDSASVASATVVKAEEVDDKEFVTPAVTDTLEQQLERAHRELNKFLFDRIRPLEKRNKQDEEILNNNRKLLINDSLWKTSSTRKLF